MQKRDETKTGVRVFRDKTGWYYGALGEHDHPNHSPDFETPIGDDEGPYPTRVAALIAASQDPLFA